MRPGEIAYPPSPAGYTSASQVDMFTKCERAWWFRYVAKIPSPSTAAQQFGTGTHGLVEKYLKQEPLSAPDPHMFDILEVAKAHLPDPLKGGYKVEGRIELPTFLGGPIWQGFIDLWEPNKHPPEVTDHKTTSNFRYAKTPQELGANVQMVSYAKWAFLNLNTNVVRVSHLYLLTRGKPKAHYVYTDLTVDVVEAQWQRELNKVRKMISLKVVTSSDDTTPNGVDNGHCHAYGGCPYRTQCGLDPSKLITVGKSKTVQGEYSMISLKEKLMAARAAAQGLPAPTQNNSVSAAAPAAESLGVTTEPALSLGVVPPDAPPRAQPPATIGTPDDGEATRLAKVYMEKGADGVAAAPPGPPAAALPAPSEAAHTLPQGGTPAVLAGEPPPKKRGRPSKADVAAREAVKPGFPTRDEAAPAVPARRWSGQKEQCPACGVLTGLDQDGQFMDHRGVNADLKPEAMSACVVSGDTPDAARTWCEEKLAATGPAMPARAEAPVVPIQRRAVSLSPAGPNVDQKPTDTPFHLYIGCLPVKGPHSKSYTLGEDWLAPIAQAVAEEQKVADYRLISYTSKGLLASGIRAARQLEGIPSVLVISENSPGADVALECLIPFAKSVTRRC